jgi:uncharacterized protein YbjT (DUF2867 family)
MKYVITGSLGHISQPIVIALVTAGHSVTVITSKQSHTAAIEALGAAAAVGDVSDLAFLTSVFKEAHAVYTMVPPRFDVTDWKDWIGQIGKNYADAIRANNIKYVVNLSSVGAHMAEGAGPVSGLYRVEAALNTLPHTHIKHLRPAYFFNNLFNNISLIKKAGIIGSNFGFTDKKFTLADTSDIAAAAIAALLKTDFTGHSVQYIASDEVSTDQIATTLGDAIGKPTLQWVTFTDDQALQGAVQAGLPEEIAKNYTAMGHALHTGEMGADYWQHRPAVLGKVKLDDFAKVFAAAYKEDVPAAH